MKLVTIKLTNFGTYENENTIEFLNSNNENKLTLVIGKNGAGKTTLLNAIKTTFYGPMLFKVKSINSDYQKYVVDMLNNNAKKIITSTFSVEITFISNILGSDGEYTIRRVWQINNSKLEEHISIYKNDLMLTFEEADDFLSILHQNYPIELFDLFFFDGERIDQLSILNHDIIDVLETAFNLNHYKTLKNDLEKYAVNKVKNQDLKQLEKEKNDISQLIPEKENERNLLSKEIFRIRDEISNNQLLIKELSHNGFKILDTVDDHQVKLIQKELDELNRIYKQLTSDILPFLAVKIELSKLTTQLNLENSAKKYETVNKELTKLPLAEIKTELQHIDLDVIEQVVRSISNRFISQSNIDKIHDISNENFHQIKMLNKSLQQFSFEQFNQLQEQIRIKRIEIEQIKTVSLEKQSLDYKIQLDQLMNAQEKISHLSIALDDYEQIKLALDSEIDQLVETRDKAAQQIWKLLKTSNVDALLIKTNKVLDEYIRTVKVNKLTEIQEQTLYMFNSIIRKDDFLKEIVLNDKGIQFTDYNNNTLTHSQISAGERQIFTLCLLVSILKTTKRVTPLVFDTLLGRLDHNHRQKLLSHLIDNATGQVIILATDSEIDHITASELSPWINKKIEIDYYNSKQIQASGAANEN